jgi:hypothetical protein
VSVKTILHLQFVYIENATQAEAILKCGKVSFPMADSGFHDFRVLRNVRFST